MGHQSVKQAARRPHSKRRRRCGWNGPSRHDDGRAQALDVLVALGERDAAVAAAELRAGEALLVMIRDGSLSIPQAVEWCGNALSVQEATRLRRLAEAAAGLQAAEPNVPAKVDDSADTAR